MKGRSPNRVGRWMIPAFALAGLLLSSPVPAAGQETEDAVTIYGGVSGGGLWTDERLYSWSEVTDGIGQAATVRLGSGPAAGLHLKARLPGLDLDAGLSVTRTLGAGGVVTTSAGCAVGEPCLSLLIPSRRHAFDAEVTLLSAHLDFRAFPTIWRIQPFLAAGVGVKAYDVETASVPETVTAPLPGDARVGTYRLGAGASLPVRAWEIVARVTDYLSGYTPPGGGSTTSPQHDVTVTLELLYRIR